VSWVERFLALVACAGWALTVVLVVSMRRRLSLVADAEHELRGAAAAIGLAAERVARTGPTIGFSSLVRMQLDRMAAGLEDLAAARATRRSGRARTLGDPEMDAGRLAQVLGNLIANATEHGVGAVDVSTSRPAGAVRIEIRNRNRPRELSDASAARAEGRGRGLAIAERAARDLGGRLRVQSRGGETRAELELPAPGAGGREPGPPAGGAERAAPAAPADSGDAAERAALARPDSGNAAGLAAAPGPADAGDAAERLGTSQAA
jgi:signal transduction histidine kinase